MSSLPGKDQQGNKKSESNTQNGTQPNDDEGIINEKVSSRRTTGVAARNFADKKTGQAIDVEAGNEKGALTSKASKWRKHRDSRGDIPDDSASVINDSSDDGESPGAVAVPAGSRRNTRSGNATQATSTRSVVEATPIAAELATDPNEMNRLRTEKEHLERKLQQALEQQQHLGNKETNNIVQAEIISSSDNNLNDDSAENMERNQTKIRTLCVFIVFTFVVAAVVVGMIFGSEDDEPAVGTTNENFQAEQVFNPSTITTIPSNDPTTSPTKTSSMLSTNRPTEHPSSTPTEDLTSSPTMESTRAPTDSPVTPQTSVGDNYCKGKDPKLPAVDCVVDGSVIVGPQSPVNVTTGYNGNFQVDQLPLRIPFAQAGSCPVGVHWQLGAEHYSSGQFDDIGDGPVDDAATTERLGYQCHHYDATDPRFTTEYDWRHCMGMKVGQTYEVQWAHSAAGACGTPFQYQTPDKDGVFCTDGVLFDTIEQIGYQAQIFTIANDENHYWPDLFRGMIVDGSQGMGVDLAFYTGSTTGQRFGDEICSQYTPISWQVDRKCHLVSASTFDKMCSDMKAQPDDMSEDLSPHGSRKLVTDNLAANNIQLMG